MLADAFYYAYNVTNNAWNTGGDRIYLAEFTVYPSSCGSFPSSFNCNITCYDRDGIISVTPTGIVPHILQLEQWFDFFLCRYFR